MRLDRFLANSGIGTRKEVKEILKKRKIKVNNDIITDGSIRINKNEDTVYYEGELVLYKPFVYIMMNKPDGVISATEDREHRTVIDLLGEKYRTYSIFPVGRLDIDTEGLLILTNDGRLAHNLLSPNKHVDKKYYVELRDPVMEADIEKLENGIQLDEDFITKDAKVEIIENSKIPINIANGKRNSSKVYITITEGKYHQVKRMFKATGNKVVYLKRIGMGMLRLDQNLKKGEYRELSYEEIELLKS